MTKTIKVKYNQETTKVMGYFPDSVNYTNNIIDEEAKTIDGSPYIEITEAEHQAALELNMPAVVDGVIVEYTKTNQELVDEGTSGVFYFFARNTDSTNFVILQTTASQQYARLSPGEFCFFPINDGNGLEARADTGSCILEYAYWKKG